MKRYLTLFLMIFAALMGLAQDKVSVDVVVPNRIVEGEHFNVQFVLNTNKARNINLPNVSGLDLLYGPAEATSSSVTIINGKMSRTSSKTFTYTFMADKAGEYTIPSATVTVGNSTYKTPSKRIKVFSQSAAASPGSSPGVSSGKGSTVSRGSGKDFFVTVNTSKKTVYEQEAFLVTFKLYAYNSQFEFVDVKFPEFDGFVKQPIEMDATRQLDMEEYNGTAYYTLILNQYVLFPQKSGALTIPGGSFDLLISEREEDPTFGSFGSIIGQYTQKRRTVNSSPFTIQVKPLPTPKPEGFTGAVGSFNLSEVTSTQSPKTGESYDITLRLQGNGNLKLAQLPEIEFPEGFEVYDPKEDSETTVTGLGENGWKTKQYFAVPRFKGDYVIPAVKFAYFDVNQGQYKTVVLPEKKVHIAQGTGNDNTSEVSNYNKESVKMLNQDIHYLKKLGSGKSATQISYLAYGLSYLAILILGIVLLIVIRYRRSGSIESVETRAKRAGSMAKRYLKLAANKRTSGDNLAYYEALLKGLNSYLSAKFHIPTSELSKDNIQAKMKSLGLSDELIRQTIDTQTDLEMARYTPDGGLTQKDELYDKAAAVIDDIQSSKVQVKA